MHQAWTLAFAAILALPLLAVVRPPLNVPVPSHWPFGLTAGRLADGSGSTPGMPAVVRIDSTEGAAVSPPLLSQQSNPAAIRLRRNWSAVATMTAGLWFAGTGWAFVMIALSLWRVRRLSVSAEEVRDPAWRLSAAALAGLARDRAGCASVADGSDPHTDGGRIPAADHFPASVFLAWSAECRNAVLAHELVHLARRDPLRHLAARLTLALYWFHPVAW